MVLNETLRKDRRNVFFLQVQKMKLSEIFDYILFFKTMEYIVLYMGDYKIKKAETPS